jgi:flagellar basal-body rod modification protein FlgD
MSAISGINSGATDLTANFGSKETSMGKEDFLQLLVAQLQNQDPMNPSDPTEFTAQLAQFSQLEQLTNMTESLEGLNRMSDEMQRMSALGLMGQEVIAQSEAFRFNGEPMELGYRLELPADAVKLYVQNQTGATVATISAAPTAAGQHFIPWDGNSDYGMPLEPGNYSLVVQALDQDEKPLSAESLIKGRVEAVDMTGGGSQLETTAGTFSMTRVERVGASL